MGNRNNKGKKYKTKACSWIWQESHLLEFNGSTFLSPCQRDKAVLINLIYTITYPLYVADIIISYPWAFNPNLINLASRNIVLWHSQCLLRSQTILPCWVSRLFSCLHLLLICVTYNKSSQQPHRAWLYNTTLRNGQTAFFFFFLFCKIKSLLCSPDEPKWSLIVHYLIIFLKPLCRRSELRDYE